MTTKFAMSAMVGLSLLLATTSAEAAPRMPRRPNYNKQNNAAAAARVQADIAAAQAILQSIRDKLAAATGKESDAAARVKTAMTALDGAKSSLRNGQQTLDEIEKKILGAQGEDSDFAKAEAAYKAAKQKLKDEQERVLTSTEYVTKHDAALIAPDKADALANARKSALDNDTDYQEALKAYKEAKFAYEGLKFDLLKQDPDWAAASKSLLEATAAESDLEAKLQGALMSDSAARDLIRRYAPTSDAAQARIAADQAATGKKKKGMTNP